ncbi:ATP-binding protein [Nakamurella sp.]|uniref:ATP-binding protein n=1 Tax=Nakamurella sp. TaxID=1869182 RepID=UPI003B3A7C16
MRENDTITAHSGGYLPDDAKRQDRRTARRDWRAAADQLVREQQDRAAAAKAAEIAARKAEYRSRTPKSGEKRPWAGRTTHGLKLRKHRATTANLSHVYPFLADGGLGSAGVYVGRDSYSGASFCYCGFDLYNRRPRLVSNTNIMMVGNIGWGKTNTAMALAVRNLPFGRRIVVPGDPKDDWLRLAIALGGQGIRLGRGLPARLNPLDGGVKPAGKDPAMWHSEVWSRRQKLLIALVATAAPAIAPLEPLAVAALDLALAAAVQHSGTPTLPDVAHHLAAPDPDRAKAAGYDAELLRRRGQPVYAVLSSLINGHLGGLFDGPSTVRFDPLAPMIALGSAALGDDDLLQSLVMLCCSAWVGSTMSDPAFGQRLFVYDEAWRIISGEAQLDRMNADLRLSRHYGIANILAMHALSDPDKVGHADSAAVKKAQGLLSLCDTRVVFRQAPGELDRATADLALTQAEREVVAGAGVGEALWKLPTKSFRVQTILSDREKQMFNTDQRMTNMSKAL